MRCERVGVWRTKRLGQTSSVLSVRKLRTEVNQAMKKPKYNRLMRRLMNVMVQEMKDGCNKCREINGVCFEHQKEICKMILHPKESALAEEAKKLRK